MAIVFGTCGYFAHTMGAIKDIQIQDGFNAAIQADIEELRNDIALHDFHAATGTYFPTAVLGAIGQNFINRVALIDADPNTPGVQTNYIDGDLNTEGIQTKLMIGDQTVVRTITANGDSIDVTYTYEEKDGNVSTIQTASMIAPVAGWLE